MLLKCRKCRTTAFIRGVEVQEVLCIYCASARDFDHNAEQVWCLICPSQVCTHHAERDIMLRGAFDLKEDV